MEMFQHGLVMTAQLILSLIIMVGLHELGHMLTAKYFGMRVEKFFIGFPPKIFSKKIGETEYGIGSIPLGGFVKITGMIDESMDKSHLSGPPKPWEFRSKPAWQRLIVMLGGVTVNAILGITIFVCLVYALGEKTVPRSELDKYGIVAYELGKSMGLQTGDRIIKVNGKEVIDDSDIKNPDIYLKPNSYLTVLRNNKQENVYIQHDILNRLTNNKGEPVPVFDRAFPFEVGELVDTLPAAKAGMKLGDKIVKIDTVSIAYFHQLYDYLQNHKGVPVHLEVVRGSQSLPFTLTTTSEGRIGFLPKDLSAFTITKFTLLESVQKGTVKAFSTVYLNAMGLFKVATGQVSAQKSLSGPVGMAKMFGHKWDWLNFWILTGMISMVLALMNLLPIPALDGGHVMFLLYEILTGRKPSDRFLEVAQYAGMLMLLSLMAFAFYNDFSRMLMP
jgi:regulator of sigma E protease